MIEKRYYQIIICLLIVFLIVSLYFSYRKDILINDYQELVDEYQQTCIDLIEVALKYRTMALDNFTGWMMFNFTEPLPNVVKGESYNVWKFNENIPD